MIFFSRRYFQIFFSGDETSGYGYVITPSITYADYSSHLSYMLYKVLLTLAGESDKILVNP